MIQFQISLYEPRVPFDVIGVYLDGLLSVCQSQFEVVKPEMGKGSVIIQGRDTAIDLDRLGVQLDGLLIILL